jgi:hypothetical protein
MPEKCHVINCNEPAIVKGLCQKHRKRMERHGHVGQTRREDWGQREQHPSYRAWCGLRRYHAQSIPAAWLEDFWAFVSDVPEKPSGKVSAFRPDKDKPWGPDNFYWKAPRLSAEALGDKAAYMRAWQKAARAADPDYGKNSFLKRVYKVDLAWFKETLNKQQGVCAICKQPETRKIRGQNVSLAVDHCHDTGLVRGLLCMDCNRGLGFFKHNHARLASAIDYLKG